MIHAITLPESKKKEEAKLDALSNVTLVKMIDMNAPVDILGYELFKGDNGGIFVSFNIENIQSVHLYAVSLMVRGLDSFKEPILINDEETFKLRLQDLSIDPGDTFTCDPIVLPSDDIRHIEFEIEAAIFSDGHIINNTPNFVKVETEKIEIKYLDTIKAIAGSAEYYPQDKGDYWVCACGRPNSKQHCVRCGTEKELLLKAFTVDNIAETHDEMQKHIKDKKDADEAEKEIMEKQELSRNRKSATIIFVVGAIILLVCIVSMYSK